MFLIIKIIFYLFQRQVVVCKFNPEINPVITGDPRSELAFIRVPWCTVLQDMQQDVPQ